MTGQPECRTCGIALSLEVGITRSDGGTDPGLYCHTCKPPDGYTLTDLQRMRDETRAQREADKTARELRLMEQLGPDVYFHVTDDGPTE